MSAARTAVLPAADAFDAQRWYDENRAEVEAALLRMLPQDAPAKLAEGMRYATLDGGKRLRPLLVLAAREAVAFTADQALLPVERRQMDEAALRAACAVELIHAYSLVHDDMPCMDNDVLRRGKPTVHVKFGESSALLIGDTLQALAFEWLTPDADTIPCALQASLCRQLAQASGHAGMAGGQALDLAHVGKLMDEAALRRMHELKTGALLQACVMMGASCGCASPQTLQALRGYGQAIGLVFQVVDDILDVTADSATLGKTAGKDAAHQKPTYVCLLGLEKAQHYAQKLLSQALAALDGAPGLQQAHALRALAHMVVARSK